MLPSANRLRRSSDFTSVMRSGARARRGHVVVHMSSELEFPAPLVGLIVGKSVGGSVQRHQVSRRLRHAMADRVDRLPEGSGTVIRALPGAGVASWSQLCADLDALLDRLAAQE